MSIAVARIEGLDIPYQVVGLSHRGEITMSTPRRTRLVHRDDVLIPGVPIYLYGDRAVILNQMHTGKLATIAGSGEGKGGSLLYPPEIIEVGDHEYYAGHGLLIMGFLNSLDLTGSLDMFARRFSEDVQTGKW